MEPHSATRSSPERLLGIDYGEKRIGLAYADEVGIAVPLPAAVEASVEARLDHILRVAGERRITLLVVGYPYNMDGTVGFKAREVDTFITALLKRLPLPLERVDERLSSHQASSDMMQFEGGKNRRHKSIKARQASRRSGELDSRAAALILRDYMESRNGPVLLPNEDPDADE